MPPLVEQTKRQITVDLRLQLDLNVQVQLQSQSQLLATLIFAALLPTREPTKRVADSVAHLIAHLPNLIRDLSSSILNEISSLPHSLTARHILRNASKRPPTTALLLPLLLLRALALSTAARGAHIAARNRLGIAILDLPAAAAAPTALAPARLLAALLELGLRLVIIAVDLCISLRVSIGLCICVGVVGAALSVAFPFGLGVVRFFRRGGSLRSGLLLRLRLLLPEFLGRTFLCLLCGHLAGAAGVGSQAERALRVGGGLLFFLFGRGGHCARELELRVGV